MEDIFVQEWGTGFDTADVDEDLFARANSRHSTLPGG
jgi:hypothetical protein